MRRKFDGDCVDGPEARLTCPKCDERFWVDPSTEENLVLKRNEDGRLELFAKCPKCGEEEHP